MQNQLDMSSPENTHSKIAGTLSQLMTHWQASAEGSGTEVAKKMSGRRDGEGMSLTWGLCGEVELLVCLLYLTNALYGS